MNNMNELSLHLMGCSKYWVHLCAPLHRAMHLFICSSFAISPKSGATNQPTHAQGRMHTETDTHICLFVEIRLR